VCERGIVSAHVDVIVNTTASRFRASGRLLERVRRACGKRARFHATDNIEVLRTVCQGLARDGTDLVAFCGGDGTFMAGITALSAAYADHSLPPVALIPGGTAATVARNLGVRGAPDRLLAQLLNRLDALDAQPHPTVRVRAHRLDDEVEERVGFIFGTGLVSNFFDVYYEDGARGYAGAARIVAKVFAGSFVGGAYARRILDPLPCRLVVDGRVLPPEAFSLVCASVIRDLGLHMMVTYRAGEDPSRLHLVATPLPPHQLGPRAHRVLLGRPIGGPEHFDDLVTDFEVRFDDRGADGEGPYVFDGDMLRARRVEVSPGPNISLVRALGRSSRR